ncbi:MAG: FkbM family methyltransferase [Candidatus Aquicultor sp.]|nr:FkbM family methyltransferase [Candidatus Aquicultor sp.]
MLVYLNGLERPLYYPKEFAIGSLCQVIAELCYPRDWHYYEIEQTRVTPGDVVVDCGAAEGLFGLLVADRAAKVYAIEPMTRFVESMRLTFSGFDNVEVLPVALSDQEGTAYISGCGISSTLSTFGDGDRVEVTTLDTLFIKQDIPVSYIKADLEGYELSMLKGARETIKKHSPKIAITTYHVAEHAESIAGYLKDINPQYRIKVKGVEERCGAPVMLHAWVE